MPIMQILLIVISKKSYIVEIVTKMYTDIPMGHYTQTLPMNGNGRLDNNRDLRRVIPLLNYRIILSIKVTFIV